MADDPKTPKAPPKAPVKLLYDLWGENEERFAAGTVVDLPVEQARALIEAGKAARADPMPGEPAK